MKRTLAAAALVGCLVVGAAQAAAAAVWLPDFKQASAKAKAEGRDLFVFVHGSDWSASSRAYRTKVIRSSQLQAALGREFLWLQIDRPEIPTEAQKEAAKQNADFQVQIDNYPGVVLLDSKGRCYLKLESPQPSVAVLVNEVNKARQRKARRDGELAQAAKTSGLDRAKHLGAALEIMGKSCLSGGAQSHRPLFDELARLDPGDTVGTQRRFTFNPDVLAEGTLAPLVNAKKYAEAHACVDKELADPRNDVDLRQHLLGLRFYVLQQQEKLDEAVKVLEQIIAVDNTTDMAKLARGYIDNITRPIVLLGPQWKPEHLRFYFAEWRLDVSRQITGPGVYQVEFRRDDGEDITVRDVVLAAGESPIAKAEMPNGAHELQLHVSAVLPGAKVWLKIYAKGNGWFGSRGTIVFRKK